MLKTSPAMPSTFDPMTQAALAIQAVFALAGLWVWYWTHRSGSPWRRPRLPDWAIPGSGFAIKGVIILFGFVAGTLFARIVLSLVPESVAKDPVPALILSNTALHCTILLAVVLSLRVSNLFAERRAEIPLASTSESDPTALSAPPAPPPAGLKTLAAGFCTFLAALPVVLLAGVITEWVHDLLGIPLVRQELVDIFRATDNPGRFLWMTIVAVVLAPLTEESIFRGGLFRYLRTRLPRWLAFVLPAAAFAVLHGNLAVLAPLTALAVVFSLSYERTGTIAVPMIAHGFFNLNTIVMILAGVNT